MRFGWNQEAVESEMLGEMRRDGWGRDEVYYIQYCRVGGVRYLGHKTRFLAYINVVLVVHC